MKSVTYDAEAEEELAQSVDWYELHRANLGREFHQEIKAIEARIRDQPGSFKPTRTVAKLKIRRALVRRFPYALVFADLGTEIRILAVAHSRRKPGYWRDRLK